MIQHLDFSSKRRNFCPGNPLGNKNRAITSARPPIGDEHSCISDNWISKSTCPTGRV